MSLFGELNKKAQDNGMNKTLLYKLQILSWDMYSLEINIRNMIAPKNMSGFESYLWFPPRN